jgi:hypothetical protein
VPHRRRRRLRRARPLLALVLAAAAGCGGTETATLAAPPAPPDVVARGPAAPPPHEVTITIEIGQLPDGSDVAVVLRETVAGDRRHVVIETPEGTVDQHVVTDDEHWWWIAPAVRTAVLDAEWIHIDVAEVERAGATLPDLVLDARRPLPRPEELRVGDEVAGYEVVAVEVLGPDHARAEVDGIGGPVVVRRRALPAGTTVELPRGATPMREVPALLGG